jgi:hypothetical protein
MRLVAFCVAHAASEVVTLRRSVTPGALTAQLYLVKLLGSTYTWCMRTHSTLGLFAMMAFSPVRAQDTAAFAPDLLLTLNPVSLVDVFGPPSLRIGLSKALSPRLTLEAEVAGYYAYLDEGHAGSRISGAGCRFSTIHWIDRPTGQHAMGIALDMGYKHTSGSVSDSIKLDGVAPYLHNYHIDRSALLVRIWPWRSVQGCDVFRDPQRRDGCAGLFSRRGQRQLHRSRRTRVWFFYTS